MAQLSPMTIPSWATTAITSTAPEGISPLVLSSADTKAVISSPMVIQA